MSGGLVDRASTWFTEVMQSSPDMDRYNLGQWVIENAWCLAGHLWKAIDHTRIPGQPPGYLMAKNIIIIVCVSHMYPLASLPSITVFVGQCKTIKHCFEHRVRSTDVPLLLICMLLCLANHQPHTFFQFVSTSCHHSLQSSSFTWICEKHLE